MRSLRKNNRLRGGSKRTYRKRITNKSRKMRHSLRKRKRNKKSLKSKNYRRQTGGSSATNKNIYTFDRLESNGTDAVFKKKDHVVRETELQRETDLLSDLKDEKDYYEHVNGSRYSGPPEHEIITQQEKVNTLQSDLNKLKGEIRMPLEYLNKLKLCTWKHLGCRSNTYKTTEEGGETYIIIKPKIKIELTDAEKQRFNKSPQSLREVFKNDDTELTTYGESLV